MTASDFNIPTFKLPNGQIPASRSEDIRHTLDENLSSAISQALKVGVNHIDTAEIYTTHIEVAHGIKQSGIDRSNIWITDKYSPGFGKFKAPSKTPYEAIQTAVKELEVDYIDLYLIHAQFFDLENTHGVTIEQAWKDLEKAYEEGLVKNIGLSNFDVENTERILKIAKHKPSVLQIEFHPYLFNQSPGIVEFAQKNDILIEAYGPLTPLFRATDGPLAPVTKELATKYGKTEAQILLRWVYQQGVLPITTSSNEERIRDALNIFSFDLSKEDEELIKETGSKYFFRGFFTGDQFFDKS
ncbi:Aldo-keto reductase family 1 member [Wickerhamomyces ciferrii]|uniref:Aldo-keto reductase family 1 member n=1 Tax=Wickerhamomyces ciferrii (strain ATCC 14091 / BCRC 22168 / CBS 111 / JCM 3599 / NBRC 0793 / NRRL Y-1031 F-60-10) TaxID=1206466 RepID=K0KBA2_WICCF|nr:Aldo-keto reductase family 1 member [Wickerhamomyces ciferrii]CCH42265.1 Aldo-keto reductase family 1 member [Wickerhamomyces ciferrii]